MADGVVELDLRPQWAGLRRRRWLIAGVTAVIVAAAAVWGVVQEPRYEARARVLVAPDAGASVFRVAAPVVDPNRVLQTELLVFESPELRADARRRAGPPARVEVRQVEQTDVIEIVASSPNRDDSAAVANAYAIAYIERRRSEVVSNVVAAAEQLQAKISDLQRQIDGSTGERQASLVDQQGLFRQKLDQLQVDGALQAGVARLISEASAPDAPVAPDRLRIGLVALVFGFVVAIGVALAVEYLDGAIRTVEDVARAAPGVPVLGVIPVAAEWRARDDAFVACLRAPHSAAAEAVRALRTSLAFVSVERELRVLQVTSVDLAEGKSSLSANLAVAFARVGRPVIVVDCDLRRPRIHRFFDVSSEAGLTSAVGAGGDVGAATVDIPTVPGLSVLPAGPPTPDPSELLASRGMAQLVAQLAGRRALVILDCPPVLPVADALAVASLADATIVVSRAGRTASKGLSRCLELLGQVHAPVAGVVLNGAARGLASRGSAKHHQRADEAATSKA